ncbi:FAS1 domain-containing protein [Terfezia boudieri ATCC MYA-4762]|uniref:FAS1 domain-containing protein n=1 Tax=Terfezia boudieri ATCC MYA-4762 TaxID=1051890 RepID=A0A3N4LUM1_9PEZI|nr:FAS1 domain-containing protein [Terfezia boudieri ATCC MYA-4762]
MQTYLPFSFLLSAFLFSIFVSSVYAQSLDEALRTHNLTLFADFFKAYPPDPFLFNRPNLVVYAPTDNAMQEYFDARGITDIGNERPRYLLERDESTENAEANNQLAQATADTIAVAPAVFYSGGNGTEHGKVIEGNQNLTTTSSMAQATTTTQSEPGATTATLTLLATTGTTVMPTGATTSTLAPSINTPIVQVTTPTSTLVPTASGISERPPPVSWLAKIYSGNGQLSYILENKIPFDGGSFYTIDSIFELAKDFRKSISESGFSALESSLNRIPDALAVLQNSQRVTFLAPSPEAFAAAENQLKALSEDQLRSLFDYHTIVSGFIGYTPTFQNGRTYKTKSGLSFVVTFKGNDIYINDAKIIARNHILKNGVIQVLDKVRINSNKHMSSVWDADSQLDSGTTFAWSDYSSWPRRPRSHQQG